MTEDASKAGISPALASFTDDLPDLSIMSLEQVVARFKDVEKRRNERTEPDNEAEIRWSAHYTPVELRSSIQIVASRMGVSVRVLTKCMSRQVVDWYTNALGLDKLAQEYNDIFSRIKLRAYTTLRIQAENPARFSFAQQPEQGRVAYSTIKWVVAKLTDVRGVVGVSGIDLLMAGFAWSLTTLENRDWDKLNILRSFQPEADNISLIIEDRLADVDALRVKYAAREKRVVSL